MGRISGIYAFTAAGAEVLQRMRSGQQQRAKAEELYLLEDKLGLSFRRTESPSDPVCIQDQNGRYTLLYSGEVYNQLELKSKLQAAGYTFRTDKEAEVVLQLYRREGQEFLKKLRGRFVLALYDHREDSLFIARDRYGEKPLLYYKDGDKLLFSSSMADLLALGVPRELDYTSLFQYLQLGYVPAPASMLKGVKKLLPGNFLYLKGGKLHQKMWHRLPFEPEKAASNTLPYKQQQAKLERLLEQAVSSRLPAHAPVGAFLDGGLNTSVVVALAAGHVPHLKTFSLAVKSQPNAEMARLSSLVADKYKTDHTVCELATQDMQALMMEMLEGMDEPLAAPSALMTFIWAKAAGGQVRHVLSGDGADELFAGIARHQAEYQLLAKGAGMGKARGMAFLWNLLSPTRNTFAANKVRQLQRFAEGAGMSPKERYWNWASRASESEAKAMLHPRLAATVSNRLYEARKQRLLTCLDEGKYSLNHMLCADWQLILSNEVLQSHGLVESGGGPEIRSPFLDQKIVKFAFSLPIASKLDAATQKKILQDTFKNRLPKELYNRHEKRAELQMYDLLRGAALPLVQRYLSDEFIRQQDIYDLEQVGRLRTGLTQATQAQVWSLVVFQHWWSKWMT
ncbi:asparagine synthase (glutamine-hydrolyzing) [Pontibacter roseus]|uniref:asparagine synthase (glutamine-hydrolyzing) n=1 Tax=Pontibacter roseus TaxID=336989 RepID=UPI00037606C4|nr:asparagine synthase (glutamine-hydrolyzing) [Pontibacter roseus]